MKDNAPDTKPRKRTQARECALQILYQHELNPADLEEIFKSFWQQYPEFPEEVRGFSVRLVRGTIEKMDEINKTIMKYAENWEMGRMALIDKNILRFATFELVYCDDIPHKVTINEAVNLAKKFSQMDSGKFVNGVLDKISHSQPDSDSTSEKTA